MTQREFLDFARDDRYRKTPDENQSQNADRDTGGPRRAHQSIRRRARSPRQSICPRHSSAMRKAVIRTDTSTGGARIRPAMRSKKRWPRWKGEKTRPRLARGWRPRSAILQALAPGDHVIAPADVYHGMTKLLREVYMRWGLEVSFVDMTNLDEVKKAVRPETKLIWVETPSNPLLKITDIAAVAEIARGRGRHLRLRQHLGADRAAAARSRLRHRHAFDHEISRRPLRRHGRRRHCPKRRSDFFGTRARNSNNRRRRPLAFRLLVDPARDAFTAVADARRILRTRWPIATWLADHPRVEKVHYPGLDIASRPRDRRAADDRIQRDAFV